MEIKVVKVFTRSDDLGGYLDGLRKKELHKICKAFGIAIGNSTKEQLKVRIISSTIGAGKRDSMMAIDLSITG